MEQGPKHFKAPLPFWKKESCLKILLWSEMEVFYNITF